ncbi:MAG: hypothetical protein N3E51_04795 [Candidatus Micrarchaeota archaeon]|nr:hypothetical protein [Candidatus Micrarchaeota archaeon]
MVEAQLKKMSFDLGQIPALLGPTAEEYVRELRKHRGEIYESGKMDCVTLPYMALSEIYSPFKSKISKKDFYNGGRFLSWLDKNGVSPKLVSSSDLSSSVSHGDIIMRVEQATTSDLDKHYNADDYAFYFDSRGKLHILTSKEEAQNAIKSGKKVYVCKHYLTAATDDGKTVIHASSLKGKVVEQDIDSDYLQSKTNKKSKYVIVPFKAFSDVI